MERQNSQVPETPKKDRKKLALMGGGIAALLLLGGYFMVQAQVADNAETEIIRFLRENRLDRNFRYREIDASLIGQSITLHNVRMNWGKAEGTIEALSLSNYDLDERSGHLRSIDLQLKGANFPIQTNRSAFFPTPPPPPFLIGMDALRGDIAIEYQYDNVKGDLEAALDIEIPDLADGHFNIRANRIHIPPLHRLPLHDFAMMGTMLKDIDKADLQALSFTLTDQGLKDQIAEYISVENGAALDGPSYRSEILRDLEREIAENPPRSLFERQLSEIVKSTLEDSGGTFSISYEPQYPSPFGDIIGPGAFALMFGGLDGLGKQIFQHRDNLSDLIDREVLRISFDS